MRWCWLIFPFVVAACDRSPSVPAPAQEKAAASVSIESVTPIPPNRPTYLAVDPSGTLFWVQETEEQNQIVFSLAAGSVPSATRLTTSAIVDAIRNPKVKGTIQSLIVGNDGRLYFFFAGGAGRTNVAVIGRYALNDSRVEILTETAVLASASRLGDSLALARGSLVQTQNQMWLWVRHDLESALLTFDATAITGSKIKRPFERVMGEGRALEMRSSTPDLVAGPGGSLLYFDRNRMVIWKIDQTGSAAIAAKVDDLPPGVSTPAMDEKGRMVLFAPDQPPANLKDVPLIPSTQPLHNFPAMVFVQNGASTFVERPRFTAPQRVNLSTLATPWLVRERGSYILYNASSGELLRLRVIEP